MAGLLTGLTDAIGLTSYGASERAVQEANKYFAGLSQPQLKALGLESVGDMDAEQIKNFVADQSKMNDISTDPRLQQAQMESLTGLQDISKTGLNAQDRAQLAQIRTQEESQARGAREAILQNAQERGVGGSGLELMSQMKNQQEAATRQSTRDQEIAALAEQRKQAALQQSGQLAGQMQGTQFAQQAQVAEANDLMNKFNVANQQQTEATNVAARNQAQQYNLQNQQSLANQNKQWTAGIPQQQYQNQLGLASAQAGGQYQLANMYNQQSSTNMQMAGMAALAASKSDKNAKEHIAPADHDIDQFLNEITGMKFEYKNKERDGAGPRVGVLAQDVAKSNIGKEMVVNDKDGELSIDNGRALNALLASSARLNERLNELEKKNGSK